MADAVLHGRLSSAALRCHAGSRNTGQKPKLFSAARRRQDEPCQRPSAISGAGSSWRRAVIEHEVAGIVSSSVRRAHRAASFGDVCGGVAVVSGRSVPNMPSKRHERVDAEAGVVADRRQARLSRGMAAFSNAFSMKVVPVSGILDAEFALRDEFDVELARISRISASLPRLPLARTSFMRNTSRGIRRPGRAPSRMDAHFCRQDTRKGIMATRVRIRSQRLP